MGHTPSNDKKKKLGGGGGGGEVEQARKKEKMTTTQNVSENVKEAREQALLGCYDEAQVYYRGAVQDILQLLKRTNERDMAEKWNQVALQY